jgi:hypothetical protein
MTKGRFVVNPFQPLNLTAQDQTNLQELGSTLIQANLDRYVAFIKTGKRKVDTTQWKPIKERENVHVYVERSHVVAARPQDQFSVSGLPALLSVGTMVGKLNDTMFGVTCHTLEIMRIKASYIDDIQGAAVLSTIVEPTVNEPFLSLVVKWMEFDIPGSKLNLVKNRDYIYLEGTGYVYLDNGDRVGYHLLHSVNFPQTHELPNRVRGNISICGFFRQIGPDVMEQYVTGIMDPRGDMIRVLAVPNLAGAFLSTLKYAYCGQMRKLAFMLEVKYEQSKERGTPNHDPVCVTCTAAIAGRRLGDFGKSSSSCKLCFGHVCPSCKVQKKLSFVSPDLLLSQRKVTFCTRCLAETTRMDAAEIAREQIMATSSGVSKPSYMSSSHLGSMCSSECSTVSEVSTFAN